MGYFNAYRRLAERTDLACVLHLGDYIYEYPSNDYSDVRLHELATLDDYRARHARYKTDPDLQELHRQHPMIAIWDDHEFADNAWKAGAGNDDAGTERAWQMTVDMFLKMPFAQEYPKLAANPDGFPALVKKLIQLEHEPLAWGEQVKALKAPVLIVSGDADVATLEHAVATFRLLGGGAMGDMGKPLAASRLTVLPATSHTAVITQTDVLHSFIEPFLKGETPKSFFE